MPTITVDIKAAGGAQFQREFENAAKVMGRTFPNAARQAEAQVNSLTKSLEVQSAVWARVRSQAVGAFAATIGVGAIASFTKSIVDSTNKLIGWQNALAAVSPNAATAAASLEFIRAEADRLGLSLESMAGQFARFSAATRGTSLEGDKTREIFTAMSEASRVLNLSVESTEGAFKALEQMVSKGKVQAEELRGQLGERLPGAFRLAADALGVTTAELNKMLETGQVTAEDLLPKLAARIREVYSAAAVDAANSPAAEFNRLSNALFELRTAIGDAGVTSGLASMARFATETAKAFVEDGWLDKAASGIYALGTAGAVAFGGRVVDGAIKYAKSLNDVADASVNAAKNARQLSAITVAQAEEALVAAAAKAKEAQAQAQFYAGTEKEYAARKRAYVAINEQNAAIQALNVARAEEIAAIRASEAANSRLAVAQTKIVAGSKALFTALGGWATVAVAAAYAIYQIQDAMRNGDAETQKMVSSLEDMTDRMNKNTESALKMRAGVSQAFVESSDAIGDMVSRITELESGLGDVLPKLDDWQSKLLLASTMGTGVAARAYEYFRDTSAIDAGTEALQNHYAAMAAGISVSSDMARTYQDQARAVYIGKGSIDEYNKAVIASIPTMARSIATSEDSAKAFEEAARVVREAGGDVDVLRKSIAVLVSEGAPGIQNFADLAVIAFGEAGGSAIEMAERMLRAIGLISNAQSAPTTTVKSSDTDKQASELDWLLQTYNKTRAEVLRLEAAEEELTNAYGERTAELVAQKRALADHIELQDKQNKAIKEGERNEKSLVTVQKQWADMIGKANALLDPINEAEEKHNKIRRDAEAIAARLITLGQDEATINEQLKTIVEQSAIARDADIESIREQAIERERAARAHIDLLGDLRMEHRLLGMNSTARVKYIAGFNAEQEMLRAIAIARRNGAKISAEQAKANIEQAKSQAILNAELEQYRQFLESTGMSKAQVDLTIEGVDGDIADPLWDAVKASDELRDALAGAFDVTPAEKLRAEIKALTADLNVQGLSQERVADITAQLETKRQALLENNLGLISEGIGSLKSMAQEGSKSAKVLELAQNAVNLALAIGAVVNQGKGDPYTAFARMAAMAAAVVPLVGSIGGFFGGSGGTSSSSSEARQSIQGTGSVLGDSEAKSESILKGIETTASATSQLVGINRGMLSALQAMRAGISGASSRLASGVNVMEAPNLSGNNWTPFTDLFNTGFSLGDKLFGSIFGGKQELIDQGVVIVGGTLSSMIDNIMASAYQTIKTDGGWFSSDKTRDALQGLDDAATRQLQLVLSSLGDAVREGARALGLDMESVNRAIEQYRIEEIRISTQGLSGEEAQKELEAVFSKIFDGLAGTVVPFVGQFQKVGEGLGETLIRVATGVQVTQEAIVQLGFALDETDPERFAQVSESLMALSGGVDQFIERMSTFVNAFATDEHKFSVAQDALVRGFEQFGLIVPDTRDAMWDLMQSLDATTESGREQIAILLELAGTADSYYRLLEEQEAQMKKVVQALEDNAWAQYLDGLDENQRAIAELTRQYDEMRDSLAENGATAEQLAQVEIQRAVAMGRLLAAQQEALRLAEAEYQAIAQGIADQLAVAQGASEYRQEMVRIEREYQDSVKSLNDAARAAGRASASERDLANALKVATLARAKALAALQEEARVLAEELYGTPLTRLDAQIQALEESESAAAAAMGNLSSAMSDAARAAAEAMGLLLGSYSPLRAVDKLPIALEALKRGETDADTVLGIARDVYSSGAAYNRIFEQVQAIVAAQRTSDSGAGGNSTTAAMQRLLDERDALLREQEAANRFGQASELAGLIAELSGVRGEGFDVVAESLGFGLEQLAADLRLSDIGALTDYLTALQEDQNAIAELFNIPTFGDQLIVDAINALTEKFEQSWGEGMPVTAIDADPLPVVAELPESEVSRELENTELLREVRDLLNRLVEPNEAAATAAEATAEGIDRLATALEDIGLDNIIEERRIR